MQRFRLDVGISAQIRPVAVTTHDGDLLYRVPCFKHARNTFMPKVVKSYVHQPAIIARPFPRRGDAALIPWKNKLINAWLAHHDVG